MISTKPFDISKKLVMQAFRLIKGNAGAAGIDEQSLANFEKNLKDNLYKLWNRMSSGSYFPPPVKAVAIPKKTGGQRILGIPTVEDRIAQMVVKLTFEPKVEPYFLSDSYGYRPNKSALDAIGVTRQRCWEHDWILEFDIKGLFDNIDHDLLIKAVEKHTSNKMELLYIKRWLKTPMQMPDGSLQEKAKGTMQGGVISPVLSNLFLHYVFDLWMNKNHSTNPWCRYADDGLVHCETKFGAEKLLIALKARFAECGLEIHPEKTKIVYCKDSRRTKEYSNTEFDFLGYNFRGRSVRNNKSNSVFLGFTPAVSKVSLNAMRSKTRSHKIYRRSDLSLNDIAKLFNPIIRGWIAYYGQYNRSSLYPALRHIDKTLVTWARHKFRKSKTQACLLLQRIAIKDSKLFAHWNIGMGWYA